MGLFSEDPTSLVFKDADGKEKLFLLDASISINTSLKAKVTNYPIEGRAFISDHVQPEPLRIRIDGMISQSPSSAFLSLTNAVVGGVLSQASSLTGLSSTFATAAVASGIAALATDGNEDPKRKASYVKLLSVRGLVDHEFPKTAMQGLVQMFNSGIPFGIRTFFSKTLYTNMVATSLTMPQEAKTGDSLRFTLDCVKVNTVEARSSTVVGSTTELNAADPAGSSATPSKDKGQLAGKPAEKLTESDNSIFKANTGD